MFAQTVVIEKGLTIMLAKERTKLIKFTFKSCSVYVCIYKDIHTGKHLDEY